MVPPETYILKELLDPVQWYDPFIAAVGVLFIYGLILGILRFLNITIWSMRTRVEMAVGILLVLIILSLSIRFIFLSLSNSGMYKIVQSKELSDNQQVPYGIQPSVELLSQNTPIWLADHDRWLEEEGKSSKQAGIISNFAVRYYKFIMPSNTQKFIVTFKPMGIDIAIWCRAAYRSLGNVKEPSVGLLYIQPLLVSKPVKGKEGCQVSVPESQNGDEVLVVMRVDSKAVLPNDLTEVVSYSIK